MNKNDTQHEGQSSGRTTGASGTQAEDQQNRTIEGQESQPGKVWQDSDQRQPGQGQYTGHGDTNVGGTDPGRAGMRGGFDEAKSDEVNEQLDDSQWQGNRFSQGGGIGNQGGGDR